MLPFARACLKAGPKVLSRVERKAEQKAGPRAWHKAWHKVELKARKAHCIRSWSE